MILYPTLTAPVDSRVYKADMYIALSVEGQINTISLLQDVLTTEVRRCSCYPPITPPNRTLFGQVAPGAPGVRLLQKFGSCEEVILRVLRFSI
jgi:hypothetical protein